MGEIPITTRRRPMPFDNGINSESISVITPNIPVLGVLDVWQYDQAKKDCDKLKELGYRVRSVSSLNGILSYNVTCSTGGIN
jgi:hypothetical protein